MKSSLKDRLKKSYQDKDKGGSGQPAFDWKKVDREVKYFKPKEGKNRINIIPYVIKSKNHPLVKTGDAKVGELDYLYDTYLHQRIGPSQTDIICLKKNFGKPCPICEQAEEYKQKGKEKEYMALRPKRMVLYNVQDVKNPEKGLQVFQISHFLFEHELIDEARNSSDNGEIIDFPDIEEGKVVSFRASTASFGGHEYFEYKSFSFLDREDPLEEDLIEEAISFDEIAKILSYEEIEKILYGEDSEPEEEEEEEEEEEAIKKSSKKPKKTEIEEEEEEPVKKKSNKVKEEDEEEPVKKIKKNEKEKCPFGHAFGEDVDQTEDCEDCEEWGKCLKAHKASK